MWLLITKLITELIKKLIMEQVALYYEPDQSVITKITKDAKMTWSDKVSWVRYITNFELEPNFRLVAILASSPDFP